MNSRLQHPPFVLFLCLFAAPAGLLAPRPAPPAVLQHPAFVLFVCLFAAQAGFLALGPVLPAIAHDLGVSSAVVGQLRVGSGVAGGLTALALALMPPRRGPRALLTAGAALILVSSL